jgi:hypothetical protein
MEPRRLVYLSQFPTLTSFPPIVTKSSVRDYLKIKKYKVYLDIIAQLG